MKQPLIVIVGETASGKSGLAMHIAKTYGGEIIGADSWTVYREFDIGTAKPSAQEMAEVPHHLFNIVAATDGFNAALFKQLAEAAITDIKARGKLPILVGGTGLYIDSILFDFAFMPPGTTTERARRNDMSIDQLIAEAHVNNISLKTIDVRNKRRIIRALETHGQNPSRSTIRQDAIVIGMQTDRDSLRSRITERVDAMMAHGLEKEVQQLAHKYSWDVEPMKGIGYREWPDYFLGTQSHELTRERIISDTLKLAKRQRTWFKRNNSIHWITNSDELDAFLTTKLSKSE